MYPNGPTDDRYLALATVVVSLALVVGPVAGLPLDSLPPDSAAGNAGVSAHARTGAATDNHTRPAARVTIAHSGDRPQEVTVRVRLTVPEGVEELTADVSAPWHPDAVAVRETEGITRSGSGELVWDGTTREPTVTFATNVTAYTDASGSGPNFAGAEEWVLLPRPTVSLRWRANDTAGDRSASLLGTDSRANVTFVPDGVVGDRWLYVGEYSEYTRNASGQRIRLVVPAAADLAAPPEEILASLADAGTQLRVGERDSTVLALVGPDPVRVGGYAGDSGFVVGERSWGHGPRIASVGNLWIHEYVHTRQRLSLTDEMEWFREASAEYYAAVLTYSQGGVSSEAVTEHFDVPAGFTDDVLGRPSTWSERDGRDSGSPTPYRKGPALLYALDQRIREESNDTASLVDVFRQMNRDERVSLGDFQRIVSDVSGTQMDEWVKRHVTTAQIPAVPDGNRSFLRRDGHVDTVGCERVTNDSGDESIDGVSLTIAADTTVDRNASGGEPSLAIAVDGRTVRTLDDVPRQLHFRETVFLDRSELRWNDSGTVTATVELRATNGSADETVDAHSVTLFRDGNTSDRRSRRPLRDGRNETSADTRSVADRLSVAGA